MTQRPKLPPGSPDRGPGDPEATRNAGSPAYVALDVETANSDCASICQVGIAEFDSQGALGRTWASIIDPEDRFAWMNVRIHGIREETVRGAPRFPEVFPKIRELCDDRIVVHHMPFDRVAIARATKRYELSGLRATWLDSAQVARRAWKQFSRRGYGLSNLSSELGIPLKHHDALSDAIAAGSVVALAMAKADMDIAGWLLRASQSLTGSRSASRRGDPAGHLSGETIVFTGALTISRPKAADLAAAAGADVAVSVSRTTTILVVGTRGGRGARSRPKSSKQRKAEALRGGGARISIIGEEDFLGLAAPGTSAKT